MPAHGLVELGAQAQGDGYGADIQRLRVVGIKRLPLGPDHHQLTSAELVAVGGDLGDGFAAVGVHVAKSAQLLQHRHHRGGHRLGIQIRHTNNARRDAQLLLSGEQCL